MKRNHLLFMLFVFFLLCIGTPLTVLAGYEIGMVNINITEPVIGETVDFTVTSSHPDSYYVDPEASYGVDGVLWYDQTDDVEMKAGDVFQAGHEYYLKVQLAPKSGYAFALNTEISVQSAVLGYVNWSYSKVFLSYDSLRKICVVHTYVLPITIEEIEFYELSAPVGGMNPEYDATPKGDGYDLCESRSSDNFSGITWYDLTADELVLFGDRFKEGHSYRVSMCVVVEEGYQFATFFDGKKSGVKAYLNGMRTEISDKTEGYMEKELVIYYDYPPCEKYCIDEIAVVDVIVPTPNAFVGYSGEVVGYGLYKNEVNNLFTKNGIFWHDVSGNYDLTTKEQYVGGHVYEVTIRLLLEYGCGVAKNNAGKYTGTATVNGRPATVQLAGNEVYVTCRFECEEIKIEYIKINEVDTPQIGALPDYEISFWQSNVYTSKYDAGKPVIDWYEDGRWMSRDERFKAGKTYTIEIYVVPVEVDGFPVGYFSNEVKASINGESEGKTKVEILGKTAVVSYTFASEETTTIKSIHIEGIDSPVVGNYPDYTAVLLEEYYTISTDMNVSTKNGITWKNLLTNNVMKVGLHYYEKGGIYEVYVTVHPADGYRFATNPDGTPCVDGYINGNAVDEVLGRSEYEAILVYSFETNPFLDVLDSTYYFEPILWAVEHNITAGTGTYTFSPDENCTRAQIVTFLWRADGSPEPRMSKAKSNAFADVSEDAYYYKAVLWAVENGITAGVTPDRFCPDDKCTRAQAASFLWRYAGQVEVKDEVSAFVDVPSDAYYYNAVLWAVKNKITAGYTKDTFAPDDTCTRGQIVTFLYRYS